MLAWQKVIALPVMLTLVWAPSLRAQENDHCKAPIELGPKPEMTSYSDYADFIVAIMDHKRLQEQHVQQLASCPHIHRTPIVERTPETITSAIANATERPPLDYSQHPTWHNRSTSRSFALTPSGSDVLAQNTINTTLQDLASGATADQNLQAATLTLLAITQNTEDGSLGSALSERSQESLSFNTENAVLQALEGGIPASQRLFSFSTDGGMRTLLDSSNGDAVAYHSLIGIESCLSSGCPDGL